MSALLSDHEDTRQNDTSSIELQACTLRHQLSTENNASDTPVIDSSNFNLWTWRLQIVSLLVSLLSFGGVLALVCSYNGKALSNWESNYLSLAGSIALCTTILRLSVMLPVADAIVQNGWNYYSQTFRSRNYRGRVLRNIETFDAASRGPYGSLILLTRGHCKWISLGAFITVLSLGLQTFSQQVINIWSKPTAVEIPGIPRANWFCKLALDCHHVCNILESSSNNDCYRTDVKADGQISLPLVAAAYQGIYAPSIPDIIVPCATGNCSWPTTTSLAVCGKCNDITSTLTSNCSGDYCLYSTPRGPAYCDQDFFLTGGVPSGNVHMNASAPNSIISFKNGGSQNSSSSLNITVVGFGSGNSFLNNSNSNFGQSVHFLAVFDIINFGHSMIDDAGRIGIQFFEPEAVQCALWPCLQLYTANTTTGIQSQSVSDSWSETYFEPDTGRSVFTNLPANYPTDNVNYGYTGVYVDAFLCYLEFDFASIFGGTSGDRGYYDYVSVVYPDSSGYSSFSNTSDSLVRTIQTNWLDLDLWIQNIAKSVTDSIRSSNLSLTSDFNGTDWYKGHAYSLEPWIEIRWHWLILPAAVLILSTIFLIASIVQTARLQIPAWKTNPLALLFFDVDPMIRSNIRREVDSPRGLYHAVGNQRVVLRREADSRWSFRRFGTVSLFADNLRM